jgi:hypothetical protein
MLKYIKKCGLQYRWREIQKKEQDKERTGEERG